VVARFEGPDVRQRAAVLLREGWRRLRLLELVAQIGREQDLHAEEGVAAGGIEARRAALVDQRRVDGHPWSERPAQREAAPGLRRLGDEEALLGPDPENYAVGHGSPPETAGRIVRTSPETSAVSSPSRSR